KRERNAVHDRHLDVGEQEIERAGFADQNLERLRAVLRGYGGVAVHLQRAGNQAAHRLLVVGDQDARHQAPPDNRSRLLKKRTIRSYALGGGEARRDLNATFSPALTTA